MCCRPDREYRFPLKSTAACAASAKPSGSSLRRQTETRKKTEIETALSLFTLSLSVPHCVFLLYLRNKFSKGFFKRKSLAQGSKACHNHLYPAGDDVGIF